MNDAFAISVEAHCDIFLAGRHFEDAEPVHAECWQVWATLRNGRRFVHATSFRRTHFCEVSGCHEEDDYCHADARDPIKNDRQAQAEAEKLVTRILTAQAAMTWQGPFNEHWVEVEPAYGSEEYQKQGCEAQRAFEERREAGVA